MARNALHRDHLLPTKAERIKSSKSTAKRGNDKLFNKVDDILDEVFADICNGVARSDVVQKLMGGLYSKQEKGMSYRNAYEYYSAAMERMAYNTDIELKRLKDIFYNRYESLLEEAVKKGDIYNAKGVLDSMAKIFLGTDKQNTNILVNADKEGITINFGFKKEETDED